MSHRAAFFVVDGLPGIGIDIAVAMASVKWSLGVKQDHLGLVAQILGDNQADVVTSKVVSAVTGGRQ